MITKESLQIIAGSSHEEQSDMSITMDNIDKSAKKKLLPRFHLNALKSIVEEGLFSDSASRDWAESLVKLLEEQTEKTKQMIELRKMKTEQKKIEQSNQSALISLIEKKE